MRVYTWLRDLNVAGVRDCWENKFQQQCNMSDSLGCSPHLQRTRGAGQAGSCLRSRYLPSSLLGLPAAGWACGDWDSSAYRVTSCLTYPSAYRVAACLRKPWAVFKHLISHLLQYQTFRPTILHPSCRFARIICTAYAYLFMEQL